MEWISLKYVNIKKLQNWTLTPLKIIDVKKLS